MHIGVWRFYFNRFLRYVSTSNFKGGPTHGRQLDKAL